MLYVFFPLGWTGGMNYWIVLQVCVPIYSPCRNWHTKSFGHEHVTVHEMFSLPEHLVAPPCNFSDLEDGVSVFFILLILSCFLDAWWFGFRFSTSLPSLLDISHRQISTHVRHRGLKNKTMFLFAVLPSGNENVRHICVLVSCLRVMVHIVQNKSIMWTSIIIILLYFPDKEAIWSLWVLFFLPLHICAWIVLHRTQHPRL